MTSDEGYELRDDGSESEEEFDEDSFDTKMAVLRDILDVNSGSRTSRRNDQS